MNKKKGGVSPPLKIQNSEQCIIGHVVHDSGRANREGSCNCRVNTVFEAVRVVYCFLQSWAKSFQHLNLVQNRLFTNSTPFLFPFLNA